MSSSGCIRMDSFQPSSSGSGGRMAPSQPTRFTTCRFIRWKWMVWVSTPLWVIFQICGLESSRNSVAGSKLAYGTVVWLRKLVSGISTPSVAFMRP